MRTGIRQWVAGMIALALALVAIAAVAKPRPGGGQIPKEALPLAGAWDITVHTPHGDVYSWLEVEPSGSTLVGRFVGMFGSARPISKIECSAGTLRFTMPPQYEDNPFQFEGRLEANRLTGTVTGYDQAPCRWTAERAPALKRAGPPKWGKPIELFNGANLDGWRAEGDENHWTANNRLLINTKGGANLISTAKFEDFRLHVEFRYPAGSNSGVYLRGRYEVQIEDDEGPVVSRHSIGGIYGFFAPCLRAAKQPGEWQTFDITLVGRVVTVVFNGETVVDRQTIPGITGGALDADEGSPGPILLQGDHGPIDFRKITITPAIKK
jgi:hypothetical protein